jgi:hypothetical protein
MRIVAVIVSALPLLEFCEGADASRCRLTRGLYEDRVALGKRGPADAASATGASRLSAGGATVAETNKLQAIDQEYHRFLSELADTSARKDMKALEACCEQAANDRAGALLCQLATYLSSDRTGIKAYLDAFPTGRKGITMLLDLDAIAGGFGRTLFPPAGPSRKLIDELFLLVLDERNQAVPKYFNLSVHVTGETATHMDEQIKLFLRDSPAVVVSQWMTVRRYRPKLKSIILIMHKSASAAEMEKMTRGVRSFCSADNPDCPDIFKLYAGE